MNLADMTDVLSSCKYLALYHYFIFMHFSCSSSASSHLLTHWSSLSARFCPVQGKTTCRISLQAEPGVPLMCLVCRFKSKTASRLVAE